MFSYIQRYASFLDAQRFAIMPVDETVPVYTIRAIVSTDSLPSEPGSNGGRIRTVAGVSFVLIVPLMSICRSLGVRRSSRSLSGWRPSSISLLPNCLFRFLRPVLTMSLFRSRTLVITSSPISVIGVGRRCWSHGFARVLGNRLSCFGTVRSISTVCCHFVANIACASLRHGPSVRGH